MRLEIRQKRCQPLRDLGPGWGALNSSKSNVEPREVMEKERGQSELNIRKMSFGVMVDHSREQARDGEG